MTREQKREQKLVDYYKDWMETYKKDVVRKVTYKKYIGTLNSLEKIVPDLKMSELTRASYQNILNIYAKEHEKTTTQDFHHLLRAAIIDAFDERILERDVSHRAVVKGRLPVIQKKVKYLNKKELEKLLEVLELEPKISWDWLILLVAKTGLRFEEAIALTPSDFDFNNLRLNVNKALDYKDTMQFCKTKNESSVRSILLDYRTAMAFERLIKDIDRNERIFKLEQGKRIYPSTPNGRLLKLCQKARIQEISMHGLRHTHASLLMYEGITLSTISRRLGHASLVTTQRVYLHMIRELETKDEGKIMAAMMELQ